MNVKSNHIGTKSSSINKACLCESPYWACLQNQVECHEYRILYWYHPDYLGHNELITDGAGEPYQYFHYSAWGETFVQDDANYGSFTSSYRFNAKELDQETGNYYYGARYYDPKVSVWLSVDAKAHWYPSMSSNNFTANNPVMFVDPNGQWVEGAGFFTNLFYSDDRNEAMLIAGDKGDFKKMDNGWQVSRVVEVSSEIAGFCIGERSYEIENIYINDKKTKRSIDDVLVNMGMDFINVFMVPITAFFNPFVALYRNKIRKDKDPYISANPYHMAEDVFWQQLDGNTQEVGLEVMEKTANLIVFGAGQALLKPNATRLDKTKIKGGKALINKTIGEVIDEIDD